MLSQFAKIAQAQEALRNLANQGQQVIKKFPTKRVMAAGALGLGGAAAVHGIKDSEEPAAQYEAGFYPGFGS